MAHNLDWIRRDLLTATIAASAGVHAALVPEHWRERPALGVGFALAAALLAAVAVALQTSARTLPAAVAAAALLTGLTVLYLLSRTYGLPLTGREEWDSVGIGTQAVQIAGVALAALRPVPSSIGGGANAHA